jgi:DNA-binding transcriptional LysR family regulator
MYDWNDLRYFLAIQRQGTVGGAARELGVNQSTVSRRLDALEDALGARLFIRNARGFTITASGGSVLELAERAEQLMVDVQRRLAGDNLRPEGVVRLYAEDAIASRLVVPSLGDLRLRHPALQLDVIDRFPDLVRGEADVSLQLARPDRDQLVARRLGDVAFGLYGSRELCLRKGYGDVLPDLVGADFVAYDASPSSRGEPGLPPAPPDVHVVFRGATMLSVAAAAGAGLGLALLPCFLGDAHPALVRLWAPNAGAVLPAWLVVHEDLAGSARIRLVMDHLTAVFKGGATLLTGRSATVPIAPVLAEALAPAKAVH